MHLHAKMDQWHREEDGSYRCDVEGWELLVKWQPESAQGTRGFWFEAKSPGGELLKSQLFEEIEHAMARAEQVIPAAQSPATKG